MTVRVDFHKGDGRRYRSVLHRDDGVLVEFDGGAYNKVPAALPHDLAHLIVEDELRLRRGVWGVLAAGGMFGHATVVAGRRAPNATATGRRIVKESSEQVMQAEVIVRAVCDHAAGLDGAAGLRRRIGERYWADTVTPEATARAVARLRDAAAAWAALEAGGVLTESYSP